ncbi:MAG: TonB-dependent receptor [Salibacteraceae bacterium]
MKPILTVLLGLVLAMPAVWAQENCTFSITGRVVDDHNNEPLPFAVIYIDSMDKHAISNDSGYYAITNLCAGSYRLICRHVGCEDVFATVELRDADARVDFRPEHHIEVLGEAVISDSRRSDTVFLKSGNFVRMSMINLTDALNSVPGVASISTGPSIGKPVINGLYGNRIAIANQGMLLSSQQWGEEHAPEVDVALADGVEIIQGAQTVKYGVQAIGGIMRLTEPNYPTQPGLEGRATFTGQSNGLGGYSAVVINHKLKKPHSLAWTLRGSAQKSGDRHAPGYVLSNTANESSNILAGAKFMRGRWSVNASFNLHLEKTGILSASHIGNLSDLNRAIESDTPLVTEPFGYEIKPPRQEVYHEGWKVTSGYSLTDNDRVEITYSRQYNQRSEYDRHSISPENPAVNFELTTHNISAGYDHQFRENAKISVGSSYQQLANTVSGMYVIPNYKLNGAAGFVVFESELRGGWELYAGTRLEAIDQNSYFLKSNTVETIHRAFYGISGSVEILKEINRGTIAWTGAYAWRPPAVNELYSDGLHHGAAAYERGNPNLDKERSWQARLVYNGRLTRSISVAVEPYVNYMVGFIYRVPVFPATLTIRGAFPTYEYRQTNALLYGANLRMNSALPAGVELAGNYSLLRAKNVVDHQWIAGMPADRASGSIRKTTHFTEKVSGSIGAEVQWFDKQWRAVNLEDYAPPPDAATLINASAGLRLKGAKSRDTEINLVARNVMNTSYRSYMSRYRYFADDLGRNFILQLFINF